MSAYWCSLRPCLAAPATRQKREITGRGTDGGDRTRLLRAARSLPHRDRGGDQEGVPRTRARAAPGRLRRPGNGGALQGGGRGVRGAVELRTPAALRPLRPCRPTQPRLHADELRLRDARRPLLGILR